jgi:hypothetical protein
MPVPRLNRFCDSECDLEAIRRPAESLRAADAGLIVTDRSGIPHELTAHPAAVAADARNTTGEFPKGHEKVSRW